MRTSSISRRRRVRRRRRRWGFGSTRRCRSGRTGTRWQWTTAVVEGGATDQPVTNLTDGCTDGTPAGTTGTDQSGAFEVIYDLGVSKALGAIKLFGDADGTWVSKTWTVETKVASTDAYATAFANSNAL